MKRLQLCIAVALLFAVLLLVSAPATLLDAGLNSVSAGTLRLVAAKGTLWSGSGHLEIRASSGTALLNKAVTWQVDAGQLLRARASGSFSIYPQLQPSRLTASISALVVSDLDLSLPAPALAVLLPAANGYGLDGLLQLSATTLVFRRTSTEGNLRLQWQDASSTLAPVAPLGSYEMNLVGAPAPAQFSIALHTLQGPLQLEGTGTIGMKQPVTGSVTARMPAAEYNALAPFLRLIAVEAADGSFLLKL